MEMALTGEPITADQAHSWGLINRVVDDGTAVEAAIELAQRVAAGAPLGVAASRELIYAALDLTAEELWAKQRPMFAAVSASEDAKEGPAAFAQKRAATWSGR